MVHAIMKTTKLSVIGMAEIVAAKPALKIVRKNWVPHYLASLSVGVSKAFGVNSQMQDVTFVLNMELVYHRRNVLMEASWDPKKISYSDCLIIVDQ